MVLSFNKDVYVHDLRRKKFTRCVRKAAVLCLSHLISCTPEPVFSAQSADIFERFSISLNNKFCCQFLIFQFWVFSFDFDTEDEDLIFFFQLLTSVILSHFQSQ